MNAAETIPNTFPFVIISPNSNWFIIICIMIIILNINFLYSQEYMPSYVTSLISGE